MIRNYKIVWIVWSSTLQVSRWHPGRLVACYPAGGRPFGRCGETRDESNVTVAVTVSVTVTNDTQALSFGFA